VKRQLDLDQRRIWRQHRAHSFVETLAFVTSVGHRHGGDSRAELGYPGSGPTAVITDLGILRPDPVSWELTLVALHPGASVERTREATGWELRVAEELETTEPPTEEELRILRDLRARTAAARRQRDDAVHLQRAAEAARLRSKSEQGAAGKEYLNAWLTEEPAKPGSLERYVRP
jgi:hypothetical protein